jgi:hypothetical protein
VTAAADEELGALADAARGAAATPHDYRQQRQCFDFFYAVASCPRKPGACDGVMGGDLLAII